MNDNFDLKKLTKKKRINSKTKGATFQRKIASILNTRFNTSEFCPTPGSGAFATTHKLPDYLKISGDLITPKGFNYSIEAKKGYNDINLGSVFNINSDLYKFVLQAIRDSERENKRMIIVFQQDRKEILALLSLEEHKHILLTLKNYCIIQNDKHSLIVTTLNELLTIGSMEWFKL